MSKSTAFKQTAKEKTSLHYFAEGFRQVWGGCLGGFLGSKRQAKTGKGTSTLYESDIKIAESLGYPDIFNLNNPEKTSNRMCRKICEWIKTHGGNMPKARSADSEESSLSEWIHYRKKCLRGITGSGEFYQSDMTIAESYGYHFFDQLKYKSSEE